MTSQSSFSGSRIPKVLLTVRDVSKAELDPLPLINCPYCTDDQKLVLGVSGQPHSRDAHFVRCRKYDRKIDEKQRCPFFRWLFPYVEYLQSIGRNDPILVGIIALYRKKEVREREKEALQAEIEEVTSTEGPPNLNDQHQSKVPRMNMASEVMTSSSDMREVKELLHRVLKVLRQLRNLMFALVLGALVLMARK